MKQLYMRYTFIPLHGRYLTEVHSNNMLEPHLFSKENRDVTLKARIVSGDNKQRDFILKE